MVNSFKHRYETYAGILLSVITAIILAGCFHGSKTRKVIGDIDASSCSGLQKDLADYVAGKDARIGIAVIIAGKDTVEVNGHKDFPLMSVVKFPQAIALAKRLDDNAMSLNDSLVFEANELMEDTYSPMLEKYGKRPMKMPFRELLEWSLIESDNNACDIIFRYLGGVENTISLLNGTAADGFAIGATEADMYQNRELCYLNISTPLAMAALFDRFYNELRDISSNYQGISLMIEQCATGQDRLAAPLRQTDAVIGHKTGTGFTTPEGRIMAVNDCGYVRLPNKQKYAIAVFIADSGYDMATTSKMIADISAIVYAAIGNQK